MLTNEPFKVGITDYGLLSPVPFHIGAENARGTPGYMWPAMQEIGRRVDSSKVRSK